MKKTIIICSCIMFASIAGLSVFLIIHNQQVSRTQNNGMQMMNQGVLSMITEDTTFEEFKGNFQDGLSEETLSEAERLFNEIKAAQTAGDTDQLRNLMIEINALGLFESSSGNWGPPNMGGEGFNFTDAVGGSSGMPQWGEGMRPDDMPDNGD